MLDATEPIVEAAIRLCGISAILFVFAILFFALASPLFFIPILVRERRKVFNALMLLAVIMALGG